MISLIYEFDNVRDLKITYIGGGSREWARLFMSDLALEPKLSGRVALYDINHEAAKNNAIIGNLMSDEKWIYEVATNLEESLLGADFVVISIQPGTFNEMESDVHTPERLGIYQAVGDTTGPGGIMRSLRTIPMYVEIASAIKKIAPKSWVINYTNPMSMCMKTLFHVFPEIKAFGCCHEIFGTQEVLRKIAEQELGLTDLTRQDIKVNVLGVNHFTWLDKASVKGYDLFPVYEKFVNENLVDGFVTEKNARSSVFDCLHRVKFDLFNKYKYIAAAGDRHLAEFVSYKDYLSSPDEVEKWGFKLTPVSWRAAELVEKEARTLRLASQEEKIEIKSSGEEGVLLIKALCGLGDIISNVNIPNYALQIANIASDAVVETNALFGRDSIRPVFAGVLPDELYKLTKPHIDNQNIVLEAALKYDLDKVVDAMCNDPLIKGQFTKSEVYNLAIEMIKNTLEYLPDEWRMIIDENLKRYND